MQATELRIRLSASKQFPHTFRIMPSLSESHPVHVNSYTILLERLLSVGAFRLGRTVFIFLITTIGFIYASAFFRFLMNLTVSKPLYWMENSRFPVTCSSRHNFSLGFSFRISEFFRFLLLDHSKY